MGRGLIRNASLGALAALGFAGAASAQTNACAGLVGLKLDGGVVENATPLAATDTIALGAPLPALPVGSPFCRVHARLKPTPTSDIQVEVWLPPASAWNGKLLSAGNGGYGGGFGGPFLLMRGGLARGYAGAGTDMGHTTAGDIDAKWALGQPEKIKDFGYRANHLTAVTAKALIKAYYGSAQKRAYFHGCSDGGREALMEAQKFPEDYDGIIAGAPASPWSKLMSSFLWTDKVAHSVPEATLTPAKLAIVQQAVLAQCDKLDGVADGIVENPLACRFDPARHPVQDGRCAELPDRRPGGHGPHPASRPGRARRPPGVQRLPAGRRGHPRRLGRLDHRHEVVARPVRPGVLPLHGVRRRQLGFEGLRHSERVGDRARQVREHSRRRQRGPAPVHVARRQAADVPGLGGRRDRPRQHHRLLHRRPGQAGRGVRAGPRASSWSPACPTA